MDYFKWAVKHKIDFLALAELLEGIGGETSSQHHSHDDHVRSDETSTLKKIQAAAPQHGAVLWRNNSGGSGRVRYGLGNESPRLNRICKSSDLIGIETVKITPDMVGHVVGRFLAVEVKRPGWAYKNTDRENAQKLFGAMVTRMGGRFEFATKPEDVFQ